MELIAGIYPAAPAGPAWSKEAEGSFLSAIVARAATVGISGLELPWLDGALHPHDEAWFLARLPNAWTHVVTAIPDTMVTGRKSPAVGLASTDDDGRRAALSRMRGLRDHLDALAGSAGRAVVSAVEVHSAPRRALDEPATASGDALRNSLQELASWDWSGASLVVEHCDAAVREHAGAKGFLPLDVEIAAVAAAAGAPTPVGVCVNWGRSAIEGRDTKTPLAHLAQAREAGSLRGLMFSGVADPGAGAPWLDNHLAPSPLDPASLLDGDAMTEAARTLGKAANAQFVGAKARCAPGSTEPADRARDVIATMTMVAAAARDARD